MKPVCRCYVVDQYGLVSRIPAPHYRRLMDRTTAEPRFTGQAIRFAEMTLWLDDDRIIVRALTWFPLVHFDGKGRRDLNKLEEERMLIDREAASAPESHWSELYRAERFAAFRWLPSQDILDRLRHLLPHYPTQVHTPVRKSNLSP